MSSLWTGAPAGDDARLLAPFRIRQNRRVLDAGCGTGDVSVALSERGFEVVAIEQHPTLGAQAEGRLATHPKATFEARSLSEWSDAHPEQVGEIDLVVLRHRFGASEGPASMTEFEADLERAARHLGPAGVIIVAIEPERGRPRHDVADATGQGADAAGEAATLRDALDRNGFREQEWFVRYPEHGPDVATVSERLWERPDAAAILRLVVRDPIRPPAAGIGRQRDRIALFGAVADEEAWLRQADRLTVAAARDRAALDEVRRPGHAWLMSEGRAPRWHVTRELVLESDAWLLRPVGGSVVRSGPFTSDPVTASLPVGENGEDVLSRWLLGWGSSIPRSRESFVAWWDAAVRAIVASPPDRLPIEIQPRNFVVTPDRAWHLVAQDLTMRFALPREVVAFRGIIDLLVRRVLPAGWIPDLPTSATIADAVRAILADIDLAMDEALIHLWVEVESDILVRTGSVADREAHRRSCRTVMERPVVEMLAELPLSRHIDSAALLAERSREIRWLNGELHTSMAESDDRRAALESTREQLAQRDAEIERSVAALMAARSDADAARAERDAIRNQLDAATAVSAHERAMAEDRGLELDRQRAALEDVKRRLATAEAWAGRPLPAAPTRWWRRATLRLREDNARELIEVSGYFDVDWYERHYPDVAASRLDPIIHYLRHGAAEGRDPSSRFDTRDYVARNPDVSAAGVNPLLHFIRHGSREGRGATSPPADTASDGARTSPDVPGTQAGAERR
jgi:hypothetical protein